MNDLFKALNDSTRRAILDRLRHGDLTAGEIADGFDISKPSISHHLDVLKRAELVRAAREGQHVRYALNSTVMEDLLAWVLTFKSDSDD